MTIINRVALAATLAIALAPLSAFAQSFTYTSASGGAIPDGDNVGISSTINVADSFTGSLFSSVTVTGLNHTWLGDLIITLSHGGRTVDILDRVQGNGNSSGGDSSNLSGDYTFVTTGGSDFNAAAAAVNSVSTVPSNVNYATVPVGSTTPAGGVSSANGLLSDFNGLNVNGAWTLNISDRLSGDTGSFTGWRFAAINPNINTNITINDASLNAAPTLRVGQGNADTEVTLQRGAVVQNVVAFNGSRLFMNGGTANNLSANTTAKLHIGGGTVSGTVSVDKNSVAYISGGTVGRVTTQDANAYVLGGTFGSVSASGTGGIFIYGGGASSGAVFSALGGASISLFGDNLAIDRASAMRGTNEGGFLGTFYNLSGTLTDGTNLAGTRFFDGDGGNSIVGENPGALFFNGVAVVPESNTFALFGMGIASLVGVLAKCKR